jgi:DNA-binding response OmpR family regulator
VDGDHVSGRLTLCALADGGFIPFLARDAGDVAEYLPRIKPHVVIVNLPLRDIGGQGVCGLIKRCRAEASIIFLGPEEDEFARVLLLEMGADDYVVKPFGMRELIARIRAITRRSFGFLVASMSVGEVCVNLEEQTLVRRDATIGLTPLEFKLLLFFLRNNDRALTRERILHSVWGHDLPLRTRTLDMYVAKLRQKLESDPRRPRHLITIHGAGYRFLLD